MKRTINHQGFIITIKEGRGYATTLNGKEVFTYDGPESSEMLRAQATADIDENAHELMTSAIDDALKTYFNFYGIDLKDRDAVWEVIGKLKDNLSEE